MMTQPDEIVCNDPWHKGRFAARYISYRIVHGDAAGIGYQCRSCGFRTFRIIIEDDYRDLTDQYITTSWEPSFAKRAIESLGELLRGLIYRFPRTCAKCGTRTKHLAVHGRENMCGPCFHEWFEDL